MKNFFGKIKESFKKATTPKDGKGKWKFDNGDTYDGEWKNYEIHGHGTYIWKDGGTHMNTGKQRKCPNCGSVQFGKKKYKTFMNDVISGNYCSNCGYNKPGGVLL